MSSTEQTQKQDALSNIFHETSNLLQAMAQIDGEDRYTIKRLGWECTLYKEGSQEAIFGITKGPGHVEAFKTGTKACANNTLEEIQEAKLAILQRAVSTYTHNESEAKLGTFKESLTELIRTV